jgi:hypothetical protein
LVEKVWSSHDRLPHFRAVGAEESANTAGRKHSLVRAIQPGAAIRFE